MPSWAERLAEHRDEALSSSKPLSKSSSFHPPVKAPRQDKRNRIVLQKSGLLSLVPGCVLGVSQFLSYADVLELRSVCKQLFRFIMEDDYLWEEQLKHFHTEMENLYEGTLLRTDFALLPKGGFKRFAMEHHLYHFDSLRAWNLQDYITLRDEHTGFFTVPLYQKPRVQPSSSSSDVLRKQEIGAPLLLRDVESRSIPISLYTIKRQHQDLKPVDMSDEDAVLQYALALSIAEAASGNDSHPFQCIQQKLSHETFSPSQILSLVDDFSARQHGGEHLLHVEDVTYEESAEFISALSLTISAVKRRRLHLDSHRHRNSNGQNTRPRYFPGSPLKDTNVPPVNRMLSSFTGQLVEISQTEMLSLCQTQLRKEWVEAIELFMGCSSSHSSGTGPCSRVLPLHSEADSRGRVYPAQWIRCFLLPEVCQQHVLALLLVDPVRAFFLIEEIVTIADDPEMEPDAVIAQRAVTYGHGMNPNI